MITEFCGTQTAASQDSDSATLNFKTLEEAILELRSLPKRDQWLLVDPNGNLYKGDVYAIMQVIIRNYRSSQPNFEPLSKE